MKIANIAPYAITRTRETGREATARAGSSGAWIAIGDRDQEGNTRVRVWHYSTLMFGARVDSSGRFTLPVFLCEGWSSQSDKQGMNQIFRSLEIPLDFGANGYAWILPNGERLEHEQLNAVAIVRDRFGLTARIPEWV